MCHRHSVLHHALRVTAVACAAATAVLAGAPLTFAQGTPGAAVVPPVVVQHVDAIYPPSALAERKHADVVLTVTVDADGHVSKVDVAQSGGADLDEAAVVAARQWTFVARDARRQARRQPHQDAVPLRAAGAAAGDRRSGRGRSRSFR